VGYAGQDRQNRTIAFPPAEWLWALKPDFHCGWEKKREFALFFFRARRFRFFFALFFLRAFALLFCLRARERESAKKAPAPTSEFYYEISALSIHNFAKF
jgi:hypothetical protein